LQQRAHTAPISSTTTTLNPLALSKKKIYTRNPPKNKAENPQILLRKIPQPGKKSGDATRGRGSKRRERGEWGEGRSKKAKTKSKKKEEGQGDAN
jgi:hypothetical protein